MNHLWVQPILYKTYSEKSVFKQITSLNDIDLNCIPSGPDLSIYLFLYFTFCQNPSLLLEHRL